MADDTSQTILQPWSTRAINLPEHGDNPIHTDAGAVAAGYPSAIVAGTTIYAYMTRPAAVAWGESWLTGGGGELRLKRAVLHDDPVDSIPTATSHNTGTTIEATVGGEVRATFDVWAAGADGSEPPEMRAGDDLPTWEFELDDKWANYGVRCGDDLDLYAKLGIAHPAMWPSLANSIYIQHLIAGPWVHTRSRIFHQGAARVGDQMRIESTVIDRFDTRAGQRAVVDMAMFANDQPVVRIEHEALVSLN